MIDQHNLLDDEGIRDFITNGYVTVHPDLPHVHEEIYRETAAIFEREGDPRNQILQRVPQLYEVFAHPAIRGVLTSLLGPDYVMHPIAMPTSSGRDRKAGAGIKTVARATSQHKTTGGFSNGDDIIASGQSGHGTIRRRSPGIWGRRR